MSRVITPEVTNGMKKIHESLVKLARDNKKKDKEIERLKKEIECKNELLELKNDVLASLTRNTEELLADFNKQQTRLNLLERRCEIIVKVIKALDVKPADTDSDNICPICMDMLGEKMVRGLGCPLQHSICPSCFVVLCASFDHLSCPLCRNSLEDGGLLIENAKTYNLHDIDEYL